MMMLQQFDKKVIYDLLATNLVIFDDQCDGNFSLLNTHIVTISLIPKSGGVGKILPNCHSCWSNLSSQPVMTVNIYIEAAAFHHEAW